MGSYLTHGDKVHQLTQDENFAEDNKDNTMKYKEYNRKIMDNPDKVYIGSIKQEEDIGGYHLCLIAEITKC